MKLLSNMSVDIIPIRFDKRTKKTNLILRYVTIQFLYVFATLNRKKFVVQKLNTVQFSFTLEFSTRHVATNVPICSMNMLLRFLMLHAQEENA